MADAFVAHVLDLLAGWGGVAARRMFGGFGLYRGGTMFALVADEVLYLKVDDANRARFEAAGTKPFTYARAGKPAIAMSYWECPPDALDSPDDLTALAQAAHAAALRSGAARLARRRPRGPVRPGRRS